MSLDILAATQRDLSRRLAADYRIVTADTPEAAFAELDIDDQVALAGALPAHRHHRGGFPQCVPPLHLAAKRLLLITYGDVAAGRAGVRAMALGLLDDYLNKPWGDPELELYPVVSSCSASEPGLRGRRLATGSSSGSSPAVVGPLS